MMVSRIRLSLAVKQVNRVQAIPVRDIMAAITPDQVSVWCDMKRIRIQHTKWL